MIHLKSISFLLIFFSSLFLNAQNSQELAKEIILKSVAKYKNYNTAFIAFDYILENRGDDYEDKQNGHVYLSDAKFRLSVGDQLIISDKITVWTYLKEVNEVQISDFNPNELEINPSEILTMWESGYIYRIAEELLYKNLSCSLLELTPEDKKLPYFKVKLLIDNKTGDIYKIQTFYKNSGLILTFEIKSVNKNPKLNEKLFLFDTKIYPGIEIVDLRN